MCSFTAWTMYIEFFWKSPIPLLLQRGGSIEVYERVRKKDPKVKLSRQHHKALSKEKASSYGNQEKLGGGALEPEKPSYRSDHIREFKAERKSYPALPFRVA